MRNKNEAVATVLLYVFSLDTAVLAQVRPIQALLSATARVVPAETIPLPRAHVWGEPAPAAPQAIAPAGAPLQLPLAAPVQAEPQATVAAASTVAGTPHDLNTWSREGDPAAGSWMVALDGGSVVQ